MKSYFLFLPIFLLLFVNPCKAQQKPVITTRVLFILDASGSMYADMGGKTRIVVAKEVLSNLVDSLKTKENLELALRVFGHQYDKKYNNCEDTKLEVPFAKGNNTQIIKKLKSINPKGTTLIAYSLLQAANDFPQNKNSRNIIILITDGLEACGGDPCAISLALQKKNVFLKPFIIGLGSNSDFGKAFSCMGQYFDAKDAAGFKQALDQALNQTLGKTSVQVNLLDTFNNPTETNVNMTFINSTTGEPVYDFVHYIKPNGKSDYLEIDPVLSYDIVVNTIPQVIKKDVFIEGGKANVINIKTPQGYLYFKSDYSEYKNLAVLVRKPGSATTLNVQRANTFQRYITGYYDVEVLTVPRTIFKNVKIEQGRTTNLQIEAPGLLNIIENIPGYGSIYQLMENGRQEWVCNLSNETSKTTMGMQPGNYKLVFRSKKASGSRYTDVQKFSIHSGSSTNIDLFDN